MSDIWKDPRVLDALKERPAHDIACMLCPRCSEYGYYNEGSHFTCNYCDITFYVLGDGECVDSDVPSVDVNEAVQLSDLADNPDVP